MLSHDLETCTADWAIDCAAAQRIFECLGIDYTCGGKSLRHECDRLRLDAQVVLQRLRGEVDHEARSDSGNGERASILGFHLDAQADWVAELSCGHFQHVRHNPPWISRIWTLHEAGRNAMMGFPLVCKKCAEGAPPDRTVDG